MVQKFMILELGKMVVRGQTISYRLKKFQYQSKMCMHISLQRRKQQHK